ncbi:hypothetical protein K438DRAFT_1781975 [Mycena galopus ATCC 62051]|nr:hypothetical protein K438DRAFT_1781975 [Mycena galopus ATCC 62051]
MAWGKDQYKRKEEQAQSTLRFKLDRKLYQEIRGSADSGASISGSQINCCSPAQNGDQSILQLSVDELKGSSCGAHSEDLRMLRGRRIVRLQYGCQTWIDSGASAMTYVFLSRCLDRWAFFHGQEDHDRDVWYRAPSCSDASQSDLRLHAGEYAAAVLAFPRVPRPPSVPLRYRRRAAALRPQRPPCAIQYCLLLPLTSFLPLFAVVIRLFSCPFPKDPAPFLQKKIVVVLAIHPPTDSYPRHNLHATELLECSSTRSTVFGNTSAGVRARSLPAAPRRVAVLGPALPKADALLLGRATLPTT